MPPYTDRKKVTVPEIQAARGKRKLLMLTSYDYPMGLLADRAGMDILLVGDSVGMTTLGYDSTIPVTMDMMIHHARAVRRAVKYALVIGDMPFMSYQTSVSDAIHNAGRFFKEAECEAVKLEGGVEMCEKVHALVECGIPVMGHLGLTPQSMHRLGGFKMQGRDFSTAQQIISDAKALEEAGAFAILLEAIPDRVAKIITERAHIPIIGIGAGPYVDGQLLIVHDLVGFFDKFQPRFSKKYCDLNKIIGEALGQYKAEVESGAFPAPEHTFTIKDEELAKIQ